LHGSPWRILLERVRKTGHISGTLSLTLREQHRLRVFENRVLRRMFGPKRDEVTRRLEKTA
jgi:hypothetical protein